jgi:hypothetical protein
MAYRAYCFVVPTAAGMVDTNVISGWDTGAITRTPGVPDDVVRWIDTLRVCDDLKVRLKRLLIAIEKSIDDDGHRHQPNAAVQRVFVAPEFYFRPLGSNGIFAGEYTLDEYNTLSAFLYLYFSGYSEMHRGRTIDNWLFLCGTCVYNSAAPGAPKKIKNSMPAFLVKGGVVLRQEVRKLCTSGIDGISHGNDFNTQRQGELGVVRDSELIAHYFIGFNLFVEICLESDRSLMKTYWVRQPDVGKVDAHVVCAAGLPYNDIKTYDDSLAVLIRNDGMLWDPEWMVTFFIDETYQLPGTSASVAGFNPEWNGNNMSALAATWGSSLERPDLISFKLEITTAEL